MSCGSKIAPLIVHLLILVLVPPWAISAAIAMDPNAQNILENLANEDYATRFDAVMRLVSSSDPQIDVLLSKAIDDGLFQGSELGSAAADFVRLKRSGKKPSRRLPSDDQAVNVFLISVDTLRADHLGCYGYERNTSPAIDRLAERGAIFEKAFSPTSWTLPAHMSIFTSLYPSFHKLDYSGPLGSIKLDESVPTLAEVLKSGGYTTAGFVAHGYMSTEWGFARGFDFYQSYVTQAERQSERVLLWLEWHSFNVSHGLAPPKFFLFAHYLDPHARAKQQTFLEKGLKPGDIRYQVARYDGAIRFADDNLGPVFEALRDRGWEDSTVVVFVSDHGEEFEDHGSTGHKNTLYDEQLRIPLIIVYPRRIEAGQRIEAPVSLLDIFPTLLDFVGVKISKRFQALIQGVSLVPYMRVRGFPRQATPEPARKIFAELHPVDFGAGWDFFSRAIRGGRFKLIRSYFKDGRVKKELYDLAEDPDEKLNVYEAKRGEKEIRELESRLSAFMREGAAYNPAFRSENRIKLDEGTQERLRALGYID